MRTELLAAIVDRAARSDCPIVVAVDGRSGVGKSTLVAEAAERLAGCTVIEGDDFYAGGPEERWDAMTTAEQVRTCIDWRKQRTVLEALAAGLEGRWLGYDWDAFDGRMEIEPTSAAPAAIVILEGAYSARPELADLLDLRVLVVLDDDVRRRRLIERDGDGYVEEWAARWTAAEDHYFGLIMPDDRFDLVLRPTAGPPRSDSGCPLTHTSRAAWPP